MTAIGRILSNLAPGAQGGATCRPDYLVVGLGNPGKEYSGTRHNIGFLVVDELARRWGWRFAVPRNRASIATGMVSSACVALVKPLTYMNKSGEVLRRFMKGRDGTLPGLIVIHDDIDLPFGRIRVRSKGSSGGHKGVQSIIDILGVTDFARLRIGIGRPQDGDVIEYVLQPFSPDEQVEVENLVSTAAAAVECYLKEGIEVAMNRYNA